MDLRKSKKGPSSVREGHDDNTKRHKTDNCLAMTPKEVLLLERRLKDRQATTTRLLSNTNRTNRSGTTPQIQNSLTIPVPPSASASVARCESFPSVNALHNEKDVFYPFHVFEKGSTSGTADESCAPTLDTLTLKGVVETGKTISKINRLHSEYVELKKVPPCKFCNVKRFEYEAPGFCCGKGIG